MKRSISNNLSQPILRGGILRIGSGEREVGVDGGIGEDAGHEGAEGSPDGVNARGVQRILISEPAPDPGTEKPRNQPRRYSHDHGTRRSDETAPGGGQPP